MNLADWMAVDVCFLVVICFHSIIYWQIDDATLYVVVWLQEKGE